MAASTSPRSGWLRQCGAVIVLSFSVVWLTSWPTSDLAAQGRGKGTPRKEEEDGPSQKGKKSKDEQEDTRKNKTKPPPVVGDEGEDRAAPPAAGENGELADLQKEAEQAKHPAVQELFSGLVKPHDEVTKVGGRKMNIEPLADFVGSRPRARPKREVRILTSDWRPGATPTKLDDYKSIEPFENLALTRVDTFLKSGLDQPAATGEKPIPRQEMLQYAEKILESVSRYHQSAWIRKERKGEGWTDVKKALDLKLQEVRLERLHLLADRDWRAAFSYANDLADKYPENNQVQLEIAKLLAANAENALADGNYNDARRSLLLLEKQFPGSPQVEKIRSKLRNEAARMLEKAHSLAGKGNKDQARNILDAAIKVYPQLPGLQDFAARLSNEWPILYVGVRDLPVNLSPATAFTDSEKHAVELLFESLVRLSFQPGVGQRYLPDLAGDLPRQVPLGRLFFLARDAYWSDGQQVTAADVRRTVQLLSDASSPQYSPEWASMFREGASVATDPFQISLTLHQGVLDPLSLMDFKVLPQNPNNKALEKADDKDFATNPVGSGPFIYKGTVKNQAIFVANPYYARAGKGNLPMIREIRYVISASPTEDFLGRKLHLLLHVTPEAYQELETKANISLEKVPNRRVYFLAVNHEGRNKPLHKLAVRRALAYAINREKILTDVFRGGHDKWHQPLNGPYPVDSWAGKKDGLPRDLWKPDLAKAQVEQALAEGVILSKLHLKYPAGDPAVKRACEMIQQQVQELNAGLTLGLEERTPQQFHDEVEVARDYELAYCHWDYANESFWLWPLFEFDREGTGKPGGRNILNYHDPDSILPGLFGKALAYREPAVIRKVTEDIHYRIYEQLPLIPLWQLDTFVAMHNSLIMKDASDKRIVPDMLHIFADVERWKLQTAAPGQ